MYHEELIKECSKIITENIELPKKLPRSIRIVLIEHYSNLKDKNKLLHMAGDGWKSTYLNICDRVMSKLNSPKATNLIKCYNEFVAVEKVSDFWGVSEQSINNFVKVRGEIAHNGRGAEYIKIKQLESLIKTISKTTKENDKAILDFMKDTYISGRAPWYRING